MRFCAVLAAGVLIYSQAMACCWNMTRADQNVIIVPENSGMVADHSCCKKVSVPFEGSVLSTPRMNCGLQAIDAAAVHSGYVTPDFSHSRCDRSLFLFEQAFAGFQVVNVKSGSGPPRFLSLRRLLI